MAIQTILIGNQEVRMLQALEHSALGESILFI